MNLSRLKPEVVSLTIFTVWLVFAFAGPIFGHISLWKWDTEIHSTSYWITSKASEPLVSGRYQITAGLTIPRFSEFSADASSSELLPYMSTPALSGYLVAALAGALFALSFPLETVISITYALSFLFSFLVWWFFIHYFSKLAGTKVAFAVTAVFSSSLWFLADLTTIHWNPMLRFAPFFLVPLFINLVQREKGILAVALGALSVLISAGNGFELLGFGLLAALTLLVVVAPSIRAIGLFLSSMVLGLGASAVAWIGSLSLRLDGGLGSAIQHVLFTARKHGTDERLVVPDGAVSQSESGTIGEAFGSLLIGSSPFIPFTERSDYATGILGLAITLSSAVVFLVAALLRALHVYRLQRAKLLTISGLLLLNLLIIFAMRNYVIHHGHILAIFSLFSFAIPAVVMNRAKV